MALFTKSDPISAAVATREKLRNRLADSETAIGTAKQASQRLALDGASDMELDAADSHVRSRVDRVATLRAALAQSDEQIAALEAARDATDDKRQRAATITEIETLTKALDSVAGEFDLIVTKMSTLAETFGLFVPEAQGLLNFTTASKGQILRRSP